MNVAYFAKFNGEDYLVCEMHEFVDTRIHFRDVNRRLVILSAFSTVYAIDCGIY